MTTKLRIEFETAIRRLAAKLLGEYAPPHLRHAQELLSDLERAKAQQAVGGEWSRLGSEICNALKAGEVDHFLRLPAVAKTVHPRIRTHCRDYLDYVLKSPRFSAEFQLSLTESPVGKPLINPYYPLSSPLLVQHAYHVIRLLEATDLDLAALRLVVDFGGGYGGFFRLLRNLGYRGEYRIWDLPVMCALQRFYLRNVFPSGASADTPSNLQWLVSGDPAAQDAVMQVTLEHRPSLFVATWSLSETPLTVRDSIAPVLSSFTHVLLVYQRTFCDCDNVNWFTSLEKQLTQFRWKHFECSEYRNNFYLIGENKR